MLSYAAIESHKLMHACNSYICSYKHYRIFTWLIDMVYCDSHHTNVDSCPAMAGCRMGQLGSYQVCWQNHLTVSWNQKGYKVRTAARVKEAAGKH